MVKEEYYGCRKQQKTSKTGEGGNYYKNINFIIQ